MTEPRRYAILIGNSEFPEAKTLAALRCPPNDVQGMREVLLNSEFNWFTEAAELSNMPSPAVRKQIQHVFKAAGPQDQILLYYSGHGKLDYAGHLHLATRDTEEDYLETTSVEIALLRRLITNNRCKRVALILDCCHSGAAVGDLQAKGDAAAVVAEQLSQFNLTSGIHVLSASTATQSAYEKEGEQYSLFTKHLLDGIQQNRADQDGDGWVSISDLYEYVLRQVSQDAAQTPRYKGVEVEGGKYIIARAQKVYSAELLNAFKTKLLSVEQDIDDDVFQDAYRVIKERQAQRDKAFLALLDELQAGRLSPGKFSGRWLRMISAATPVVLAPSVVLPPAPVKAPPPKQPANFTENLNGVPLEMIYVPGGNFMMGSPDGQGDTREYPQHLVNVPGFYIGKYPVTQEQWQAVMSRNPSKFKGEDMPVEQVSWKDAKEFCFNLKNTTGRDYRLPSEAEWEYACRASTTSDFAGEAEQMGWYRENSGDKTHIVGEKSPNAFGLYDMHGNVWEWCEDVWHSNYIGAPDNGTAWMKDGDSTLHVLRGGSWTYFLDYARSAYRNNYYPSGRDDNSGFRLVVTSAKQ
jgi:formylglycine-generating enzyme required for sulfatase activity